MSICRQGMRILLASGILLYLTLLSCDQSPGSWEMGPLHPCVSSSCDSACMDDMALGGICRDGECTCLGYQEAQGSCVQFDCDRGCWEDGFLGGACRKDRCECLAPGEEDAGVEDCQADLCDAYCLDHDALGGACREDGCMCIRLPQVACDGDACDQQCIASGSLAGICKNDRCTCVQDTGGLSCAQALMCAYAAVSAGNYTQIMTCVTQSDQEARQVVRSLLTCLVTSGCTDPATMFQCLLTNCGADFNACLADYE